MTDLPKLGQPVVDDAEPAPDDRRLWSVTTIVDVIAKPALIQWAAKETAKCALDRQDVWRSMREADGDGEAIKWLANARFRAPKGTTAAAELGTNLHAICEEYALTGMRPAASEELAPFVDQFDRWLNDFQPEYSAAEVVVFNPTYGYAGTADTFCTIDGVRFLIDYKSTREPFNAKGKPKTPYSATVLQLAGYRYAELAAVWRARRYEHYKRRYYLLSPLEAELAVPVPTVDACGCLLITPVSCELFPMRADERAFEAFLFALEVARWEYQSFKGSVGDPMLPPNRADEGETS